MPNKRNPFDEDERGLARYRRLKEDVQAKSERVFDNLPLFVRIVLIENGGSTRWREFNRFDLINPIFVYHDFPAFKAIAPDTKCCTELGLPIGKPGEQKAVAIHDFLKTPIIEIRSDVYTVHDFIWAVAYHKGIHNQPDEARLKTLYADFIKPRCDIALAILHDIASCFVEAFADVFEKFSGDNSFFCREHRTQPLALKAGLLLKNTSDGRPVNLFSNAYMQGPIPRIDNHGLRIGIELSLCANPKDGTIFAYGHREDGAFILTCAQRGAYLIVTVEEKSNRRKAVAKVKIEPFMLNELFKLEVALYTWGVLVVGVNENMSVFEVIGRSFCLFDGKLIFGADLDGSHFGEFYWHLLSVESINPRDSTASLFRSAMHKMKPFDAAVLPASALYRPILD